MPYNPSSDFVGLWRAVSGGVEKGEMPGLDFVVAAMARAGLLRVVNSATAPATSQSTTAWFRPANPSFASEGTLYLWDTNSNSYAPATPELYHAMISGGDSSGGGSGSGDGGIPEAPNDGVQYGRQSLTWTPVTGSTTIPPGGGTGVDDMAIISSTPPSNPATGAQWWNGTVMQVWDGGKWNVVGPPSGPGGAALETSTLVFAINQETTLTNAANAWAIVPWIGTPVVDTKSGWDGATKKFTPKEPGYYAISARVVPTLSAGTYTAVAVLKNDDGIFDNVSSDIMLAIGFSTVVGWVGATGFAQMNGTTDYIRVFSVGGGTLQAQGSSPAFSVLRMP